MWGVLGKFIVAKGFKKLPKKQKNRPFWSHCMYVTSHMHGLPNDGL